MPRELTDHRINSAKDQLTVTAVDEPGPGGVCHAYEIEGFRASANPSALAAWLTDNDRQEEDCSADDDLWSVAILFQNGPIAEVGVNGITDEALLAILIDRLRCYQAGPHACHMSQVALVKLDAAQDWLRRRTQARMARGVEGTSDL